MRLADLVQNVGSDSDETLDEAELSSISDREPTGAHHSTASEESSSDDAVVLQLARETYETLKEGRKLLILDKQGAQSSDSTVMFDYRIAQGRSASEVADMKYCTRGCLDISMARGTFDTDVGVAAKAREELNRDVSVTKGMFAGESVQVEREMRTIRARKEMVKEKHLGEELLEILRSVRTQNTISTVGRTSQQWRKMLDENKKLHAEVQKRQRAAGSRVEDDAFSRRAELRDYEAFRERRR